MTQHTSFKIPVMFLFSKFLQSPLIIILTISILLNAALWLQTFLMFSQDDTTAILHYSIDIGIDFIGQGKQIIVLPLVGLLLLIGNTVLGAGLKRADIRSAYILWSVIPIIQLILQGAFILIWQVNQ